MSRVWFITGCSSGFGRLLAERALTMGDRVVATARSIQSIYDLGSDDESRILRVPLDVCDTSQIDAGVTKAIERFGAIDILVNNAGYGYFATQEEGELEEVRRMFDTNVFGLIAMTQRVVPHMRERRQGTIINLSSIAGRIATARGGFYQATKWAVEALSEALYLETSSFGLRVVVIEPGSYETDFGGRSVRRSPAEDDPASPYNAPRAHWKANSPRVLFPRNQNPVEVIDAIIDAVESKLPFVRLLVGTDASSLVAKREELGGTRFVEWLRKELHESRTEDRERRTEDGRRGTT